MTLQAMAWVGQRDGMIGTLRLTFESPSMDEALAPSPDPPERATVRPADAESSFALLARARGGDADALNDLCTKYLPRLRRWAHGRLPAWARGALDTHDLVQDTLTQVLQRLQTFDPRHPGAFPAYLRQALLNRVRDEIRRAQRRGPSDPLDTAKSADGPSPLEEAIGQEALERYEAALQRLRREDREAIIVRIEMGHSAAHMAVSRALVRLAKEMASGRT
jgi:RNA polymerase sigma factor (sigma-70 family)